MGSSGSSVRRLKVCVCALACRQAATGLFFVPFFPPVSGSPLPSPATFSEYLLSRAVVGLQRVKVSIF